MLPPSLGSLLAAVEDGSQHFLKPFRLKQSLFDMAGNEIVQLLHRNRAALAAGLALPGLGRAGVVAIAPTLAGPERHGTTAIGAEADAGKEGGAADDSGGRDPRVAGTQMRLHGVEGRLIDQRRHLDRDAFAGRLNLPRLAAPVEFVAADIGGPGQDIVHLSDAPASAVAGEDAPGVEVGRDRLDAHRAGCAVAL